jgi:heme-degrading monooxygenase HmoA
VYAVIFRATASELDAEYSKTASRLRELAINQFGCLEFVSVTEGNNEIAISYWPDEESIKKWKAHSEHVLAQELGRKKWYESYVVQITEIKREYKSNT